ncbi:hypothetical protein B0H13DRAFT_2031542 [Mycena leptocephala]|nr:hypothetical protein B0H13DRAFT_2031542 [Mycena leptocephala]
MSFFTSLFEGPARFIELTTTESITPFAGSLANPRRQRYPKPVATVVVPQHPHKPTRTRVVKNEPSTYEIGRGVPLTNPSAQLPSRRHGESRASGTDRAGGLYANLEMRVRGLLSQTPSSSDNIESTVSIICSASEKQNASDIIMSTLVDHPKECLQGILECVAAYQRDNGILINVAETARERSHAPPQSARASKTGPYQPPVQRAASAQLDVVGYKSSFRKFSSITQSSGSFRWHQSTSEASIQKPLVTSTTSDVGDIFTHSNINEPGVVQAWLYSKEKTWVDISDIWQSRGLLTHPTFTDRVLKIRTDGSPNWILSSSTSRVRSKTPAAPGSGNETEHSLEYI